MSPTASGGEAISVELTVLGSGSGGNATLVSSGDERVLIDAGLSYRALRRRLEGLAVDPDSLRAVLVTHGPAVHHMEFHRIAGDHQFFGVAVTVKIVDILG